MKLFVPALFLAFAPLAHPMQEPGGARLEARPGGAGTELVFGGRAFHRTAAAVDGLRRFEAAGVVVVAWTEGAGAAARRYSAISLDGRTIARVHESSGLLQLEHGPFDPLAAPPAVDARLAAREGSRLRLVQLAAQPIEPFLRAIEALGARVLAFVPDDGYVVDLAGARAEGVAGLPFVRAVAPHHAAYKLDAATRLALAAGALPAAGRAYNVLVFEKGVAPKAEVVARAVAGGAGVQNPDAGARLVELVLTPEQLVEVAHDDRVQFVDLWGAPEADMDVALVFGGGNYVHNTLGFTGAGVRGEVMDGGLQATHAAFTPAPLVHGPGISPESHGSSTFGIVFADGNVCMKGMLPGGTGIFATYFGLSNRYQHTAELVDPALPWQAVFQSNSWGGSLTTTYTTVSAEMDQNLFDNDLLIFQSQSNWGSQTSRPEAWAKNIVSIGGVRHQDSLTTADDSWSGGASIGPAADGRIKPDLAHFYDLVATTSAGSNFACTTLFSGTSSATPIVAGHGGIFFQLWHAGLFGNQPGVTVFDSRPHMTLAKAMLINTADQWTFAGANHDLTRTHQGWGRPNVKNVYDRRVAMYWVDESDVLTPLASTVHAVTVAPGETALRVTMVYADPPGNPTVQSQHRVNDLTLKAVSPSGATYWGNQGLRASMWSTPGGAADPKDTVECVFVQNPEAGGWQIEVLAAEVNLDGHVETPELDADYSLVVTGATGAPPQPGQAYCAGDSTLATFCPCFNFGAPGHGCANSASPDGARLAGSGEVATDTVELTATELPPGTLTIFIKGEASDPLGTPFGDGVRCVAGSLIRFGQQNADAQGTAAFPGTIGGTVSAAGGTPPGSAITAYYQAFFRDPDAAFCPPATYNITNGYTITW